MTNLTAMVNIRGLMDVNTLEDGNKIPCLVLEYTLGRMAEGTKDVTSTIVSMAMVFILGLTAQSMKAVGSTASNMSKASTYR
jgi:hypothetical protein